MTVVASELPVRVEAQVRAEASARVEDTSLLGLLAATVDELDYGLLLLDRTLHVAHANHAARCELHASHPLQLLNDRLQAHDPHDAALLRDALADVFQRGHRKMLTMGPGARRISLSLVPLAPGGTSPKWALVLLGKPQVCQDLSVEAFARAHKLTPVETQVLKGLCRGARPAEIARSHNVALSTVRTHVGSIRSKTSVPSIGALLRTVSMLPPIVSVLRQTPH
ncbi:MAG TPA: LuxR C-terminal-related transcriptional regulator [Burkholderiaceae bacterium]|nr:LuxR C-terminal-related transcriptional regulator [Burkholderiaceae bacterium]